MYRVAWMTSNGISQHGEYCLTLEAGKAWIEYLTNKYPDMKHWLEQRV